MAEDEPVAADAGAPPLGSIEVRRDGAAVTPFPAA